MLNCPTSCHNQIRDHSRFWWTVELLLWCWKKATNLHGWMNGFSAGTSTSTVDLGKCQTATPHDLIRSAIKVKLVKRWITCRMLEERDKPECIFGCAINVTYNVESLIVDLAKARSRLLDQLKWCGHINSSATLLELITCSVSSSILLLIQRFTKNDFGVSCIWWNMKHQSRFWWKVELLLEESDKPPWIK